MTQTLKVEGAFGASLTANPSTWTWTDITRYARGQVTVSRGRQDWLSQTQPARCSFRLANSGPNPGDDGRFTPRFPASPLYPNVRRNVPIRVSLNGTVRFQGYADDFAPTWPGGPDLAEVNVTASGILKRLGKGQSPVKSAMRRAISAGVQQPKAYWPCEDPSGSALLVEASGRAPMTFNGPVTLGSGGPPGSAGAVTVGDNVELRSTTNPTVGSTWIETGWTVECCVNIAQAPAATTVVKRWETAHVGAGTFYPTWSVSIQPGSPGNLLLQSFNADGSLGAVNLSVPFVIDGAAPYGRDLLLTVEGVSPSINATLTCADILTGSTLTVTGFTAGSVGSPSTWIVPAALRPGGWRYSHIGVFDNTFPASAHLRAAQAWNGETAGDRLTRLCSENSIPYTAPAATTVAMGPQRGNNLLALLRECEAADQGILYDGLTAGIAYLPADARYNQAAQMTLDNNRGHIKKLFAPVEDDQRVRNDWTVSRPSGGSARSFSQTHIDANGLYDDSATVNVQTDAQLADQGGWRLNLGTVEEMRIPAIEILPSHSTDIQSAWLAMDLGERFDSLNLPVEYPPGPYQAVLEGYNETFDAVVHSATLNSSPFAPWRVMQWAAETGDLSEFCGRWDLEGVTLQSGITAQPAGTVESWNVLVTGSLITTLADDLTPPIQTVIDGEVIYITGVTGTSSPQTLTVKRAMNGVVKSHAAGATVASYKPLVWAL